MASLALNPKLQFFDSNGDPLSGGLLYTYASGTSTPLATYTDQIGGTANANPVVLDARGEADVWLAAGTEYRATLKTSAGATVWGPIDHWVGYHTTAAISSAYITFLQSGTGAVSRTLQARGADSVSVLDFIPVSKHATIADRTSTDDLASYIQAAVDAAPSNGGTIYFPPGRYTIESTITMDEAIILRGAGHQTTTIRPTHAGIALAFGSNPSAVKRGMGMSDIGVVMTNKAGTALYLKGIVNSQFENVYIEGSAEALRSDKGVVIDGYNASSFFNTFKNVEINHIKTGFHLTKTGTTNGTNQVFMNCSVFGDVATLADASVGLQVDAEQGNGSVWTGGNIESCAKGMLGKTDANPITVVGCRFEANTADIEKEVTSYPWQFIGCANVANITDSGGSGFQSSFLACTNASGYPIINRLFNALRIVAQNTTDTPLQVAAVGSQTAPVAQFDNATGTSIFKVNPDGTTYLGSEAVATNATAGYVRITSCAGTPTGAPGGSSNWAPIIVDSTNNKLYFYSGGAWRDAGP